MANLHKIAFHLIFLFAVINCLGVTSAVKPTVVAKQSFVLADDVNALKTAMSGSAPTAPTTIIELLAKRSTSQRLDIVNAYDTANPEKLAADIKKKVTDAHSQRLVDAMMTPLPDYYVGELHDAKDRAKDPNPDVSPIVDMLFSVSDEGILIINNKYTAKYTKSFEAEFPDGDLKNFILARNTKKRDDSAVVDSTLVNTDVTDIIAEGGDAKNWNGPGSKLFTILLTRNYQHLNKVFEGYSEKATVEKDIGKAIANAATITAIPRQILSGLVKYVKSRQEYFADRLDASLESIKTPATASVGHNDLIRLVVSQSEIDLGSIVEKYNSKHAGKNLEQAITELPFAVDAAAEKAGLLALIK